MKKRLCKLLAFIMFISSFVMTNAVVAVAANEPQSGVGGDNYKYFPGWAMRPDRQFEVRNSVDGAEDQVLLGFPATANREYTLTYAYANNLYVEVTFKNTTSGGVNVVDTNYTIKGTGTPVLNTTETTLTNPPLDIYTNVRKLVPGATLNNPQTENIEKPAGTANVDFDISADSIKHQFKNDTGLGFVVYDNGAVVDSVIISVLNGMIYFASNKADQSDKIYDFTLRASNNVNQSDAVDLRGDGKTFHISTGYMEKQDIVFVGQDNTDHLDINVENCTGIDAQISGANPTLTFRFNLPKKWVWTNPSDHSEGGTFEPIAVADKTYFTFDISNDIGVKDIENFTAPKTGTANRENTPVVNYTYKYDPNNFEGYDCELTLSEPGITASTIYNNLQFNVQRDRAGSDIYGGIQSHSANFDTTLAHTLLEYRFDFDDIDQLYKIYLTPYSYVDARDILEATYSVYSSNSITITTSPQNLEGSARRGRNDTRRIIEIPINAKLTDINAKYYQIYSNIDNYGEIKSQISHYKPVKPNSPGHPRNLQILEPYPETIAVKNNPGDNQTTYYSKVKFSFGTGLHQTFINMLETNKDTKLSYWLDGALFPSSDLTNNILKVELEFDTSGDSTDLANRGAELVKSINITMEDGTILTLSADYKIVNDNGIITAEVMIPVFPKEANEANFLSFINTYFVSMTVYKDGYEGATSNDVQLNINAPASYEVPAPSGFRITSVDDVTESSFKVRWSLYLKDVFKYMDYMLNPQRLTLNEDSITFDMYLGNDHEIVNKLANGENLADEDVTEVRFKNDPNRGSDALLYEVTAEQMAFLRGGGIIKLTGIPGKGFNPTNGARLNAYNNSSTIEDNILTIRGLDDNVAYFAAINTILAVYETEWKNDADIGIVKTIDTDTTNNNADNNNADFMPVVKELYNPKAGEEPTHKSEYTSVVTVTTKVNPTPEPDPKEFQPPAPENLNKDKVLPRQVDIFWDVIPDLPEQITEGMIQYEIVRVQDKELQDFLNNTQNINDIVEKFWSDENKLEFWGTYNSYGAGWLPTGKGRQTEDMLYIYPEQGDIIHLVTNSQLTPGTIYYYYVRTVLMDDSNPASPIKHSVWIPISVTTPPLERPENVKHARSGAFDLYSEALLTFDAPAKGEEIFTERKYDIEYQLKKDTDDWGTILSMTNPSGLLKGGTELSLISELASAGYYRYEYFVKNLLPGSTYVFRARMVDRTTDDKSMWSVTITIRTEVDPDTPPDLPGMWKDSFIAKAEELLKRPYWPINKDSASVLEAVYRTSMIDGVIGGAADNFIVLDGTNRANQVYYIPASSIEKTDLSGKGFRIKADNVEVFIPATFITAETTNALTDIASQINNRKIRDYFVQISFRLVPTRELVNGNAALTDRIELTVKTVGFTQSENIWDAEIANMLRAMIDDESYLESVKNKIAKEIDNGASEQEIVLYIDKLVNDLEKDFLAKVKTSFNDKRLYEYEVLTFAVPVRITGAPKQTIIPGTTAGSTISGFKYFSNTWQSQATTPYLNGSSMLTGTPGVFIFSMKTINIPGIGDMSNSGAITDVVVKYGLEDFFMTGNTLITATPLTNDQLIGSVARMAGAGKTQDAAAYLRSKGINVSARNMYGSATNETTVYMVMSLYEIKTKTKVSSIKITNHNILSGINGVGATYVPHYKAAYTIGILSKPYQPKQSMTVKEYIEILGKLASKTGL